MTERHVTEKHGLEAGIGKWEKRWKRKGCKTDIERLVKEAIDRIRGWV
jgi:hypothetical protein